MLNIPQKINAAYDALLIQNNVPLQHHAFYKKCLRYYWDFCHKYHFSTEQASSLPLPAFIDKLQSKRQSEVFCEQAKQSVLLYHSLSSTTTALQNCKNQVSPDFESVNEAVKPYSAAVNEELKNIKPVHCLNTQPLNKQDEAIDRIPVNRTVSLTTDSTDFKHTGANWVLVYDNLKAEIKLRNYLPKTFSTYRGWVRKFQTFLKSKDSRLLTQQDVKAFLTHLAVDKKVAASTQNQALNALLFLFRHVLILEFGELKEVPRAKRTSYVPVVLTRTEVNKILIHLREPFMLPTKLLYGCGLRISECLNLRLQDFNLDEGLLTVRHGKGKKGRVVPLPQSIMPEIQQQVEIV